MIDKETWNIKTDHSKMGKLFKYSMPVQYKKCIYIYIYIYRYIYIYIYI